MKRVFNYKKKISNRIISLMSAFVFVLFVLPLEFVPQETEKMAELALDAHAEVDSTILAKYDSEHNHSFLSGELKLSEYSQCFEDATFAANHANDTITLAPTGDGVFVFDANYNPIGTEASPFIGTIVFRACSH